MKYGSKITLISCSCGNAEEEKGFDSADSMKSSGISPLKLLQ